MSLKRAQPIIKSRSLSSVRLVRVGSLIFLISCLLSLIPHIQTTPWSDSYRSTLSFASDREHRCAIRLIVDTVLFLTHRYCIQLNYNQESFREPPPRRTGQPPPVPGLRHVKAKAKLKPLLTIY
ncbi:hypothetical protein BJ138DRAFT_1167371 [Hygrophoropsis aurantiaca]|uniref:Uncharacterized protein n=1 Tax=Hygrophoropsis aurantiaca TaxID=72124 RepID=A0ACB7ZSW4_9AGAM|nr:hypothetical protein BJ138DRAFT_1167371 [Hygrophoropsis aurantiaca]